MDAADELDVGGQVAQDALATVEAVGSDHEGALGEGGGEPADQFQTKLWPGLM
jgi:hypothetical protein